MKIEQTNPNQIKCILNKNDLTTRNLEIDNLIYGTEPLNSLVSELIDLAKDKFNFITDNSPLTIEAVPMPGDILSITITKNDDPEELDTRFSKFSPTPEDVENAIKEAFSSHQEKINKANEILSLLSSFKDALLSQAIPDGADFPKIPNVTKNKKPETLPVHNDINLVFVFENMDKLISLSKILATKYVGESSIYKNNNEYFLLINNNPHTPEEFNQICNIICEYGRYTNFKKNPKAYLNEHYELILEEDALQQLSNI